jgi:hydroxyquinol 1,2-dioxygenase
MRNVDATAMAPEHLHFRTCAEDHAGPTRHIFHDPDPYLDSDVVFGVRSTLIGQLESHDAGTAPNGSRVPTPFFTLMQDFVLAPTR